MAGTKWMDSVLDILRAGSADELEAAVYEWTGERSVIY